jgi:hypothetical protein
MSITSTGLGHDAPISPLVYSINEVAVILKISRAQAYAMAAAGIFPVIKVGVGRKSLRAPRDGIHRLLRGEERPNAG